MKVLVIAVSISCAGASSAPAQEIQRGAIVDPVQCVNDRAQTYALYLPSRYAPERGWSVLFAFHPAARGRLMVEIYRAAAEQYGFIIAASNNARNGPHAVSTAAAQAMSTDVGRRFSIDSQRVYLAGMSGGVRVAMAIALAGNNIAGVIASEKRRARIATTTDSAETVYLLSALVSDFKGLVDVPAEASRLDELSRQSAVKKALKRERDADDAEGRVIGEIFELEARVGEESRRAEALMTLRGSTLETVTQGGGRSRHARAQPGAACPAIDYGWSFGTRAGSGISEPA